MSRKLFWDRVLDWGEIESPGSIFEIGAGHGANFLAIREIYQEMELEPPHMRAVEHDENACADLVRQGFVAAPEAIESCEISSKHAYDMTIATDVLCHLDGEVRDRALWMLGALSRRWVLIAEPYAFGPTVMDYPARPDIHAMDYCGEFRRGHVGEFDLVDYGFAYHGDPECPMNDLVWFLLKRKEL